MKDLMIYGAGGFGQEIACLIRQINEKIPRWNLLGFLDDGIAKGTPTRYGPVLGTGEELNHIERPIEIVTAIGSPSVAKNVVARITNPRVGFPNVFAPDVHFLDESSITMGRGNIITFGCRISYGVVLGDFNILNTGVTLGHGARLGNYNSLMPSINISGDVVIGDENFFGVRSAVLQGIQIGDRTRIGAGSVVIHRTHSDSLYSGNPAKRIMDL